MNKISTLPKRLTFSSKCDFPRGGANDGALDVTGSLDGTQGLRDLPGRERRRDQSVSERGWPGKGEGDHRDLLPPEGGRPGRPAGERL